MLQRVDEVVRHVDLGQVRRDTRSHLHARHDEDTREYLAAIVEAPPPLDERLRVERRLNEQKSASCFHCGTVLPQRAVTPSENSASGYARASASICRTVRSDRPPSAGSSPRTNRKSRTP